MLRSSVEYYYLLYFLKEIFIYLLGLSAAHREGNGTPLQYSCLENPMD